MTSECRFPLKVEFLNGIRSCNEIVKEVKVYCCFSDVEQKYGANLNGADVRTFDVATLWCAVASAVFRSGLTTGTSRPLLFDTIQFIIDGVTSLPWHSTNEITV